MTLEILICTYYAIRVVIFKLNEVQSHLLAQVASVMLI